MTPTNEGGDINISPLNTKHFSECCERRKLDPRWIAANCRSVDKKQAELLLGYPSKSDGIWMQGCHFPGNPIIQGQFRPDTPWISKRDRDAGRSKSPKYRSPQDFDGGYDVILVNSPDNPHYWSNLLALKERSYKIDGHPCLFLTEGVFKAIAGCYHLLPTIAALGVEMALTPAKKDLQGKRYLVKSLELLALNGFGFILAFDADCATNENVQWAQRKLANQLKLFNCPVYSITGAWNVDEAFENQNKGMDDYILNHGIEKFHSEVLSKLISIEKWQEQIDKANSLLPEKIVEVEEMYTQKAESALYSNGKWIAIDGALYKWTGTHYQECDEEVERARIRQWCHHTAVSTKNGWKYAYATSEHVNGVWNWLLDGFSIPSHRVNPPGLNCLNGVIKIDWIGKKAKWHLEPHNPENIYTYCSSITVDPSADPTDCDRLLECLEPEKRLALIQTLACCLDLPNIRRHMGRFPKVLLATGSGENGKNAIRYAMEILLGVALTDAALEDFQAYDGGAKNELAKLRGSLLNWPSENSQYATVDKIQSLKAVASGDPLYQKILYKEQKKVRFNTVLIFNFNNPPQMEGGQRSSISRFAVLKFNKCYTENPDPSRGELQADPRFCYDRTFMEQKVVPALLNKLLTALETICETGIDYKCMDAATEEVKQETDHLWIFVKEVGLTPVPEGKIYLKDLWQRLRDWYIEVGTLELTVDRFGNEAKVWHDQVRKGDKNVTRDRDLPQRLKQLFPKIKVGKETQDPKFKGVTFLEGLGYKTDHLASLALPEPVSASPTPSENNSLGEAETIGREASEAKQPKTTTNFSTAQIVVTPVTNSWDKHPLGKYLIALPVAKTVDLPDGRTIELSAEYPGTKGRNQTQEPFAIRSEILQAQSDRDWQSLLRSYGDAAPRWVWLWMIGKKDKARLKPIFKGEIKQLPLEFDSPQSEPEIGD